MAIKKKKYRKQPKSSASLEVWERYKTHCMEVDKFNAKQKADAAKKVSIQKAVKSIKSK